MYDIKLYMYLTSLNAIVTPIEATNDRGVCRFVTRRLLGNAIKETWFLGNGFVSI